MFLKIMKSIIFSIGNMYLSAEIVPLNFMTFMILANACNLKCTEKGTVQISYVKS